jgi:hypothetical protein
MVYKATPSVSKSIHGVNWPLTIRELEIAACGRGRQAPGSSAAEGLLCCPAASRYADRRAGPPLIEPLERLLEPGDELLVRGLLSGVPAFLEALGPGAPALRRVLLRELVRIGAAFQLPFRHLCPRRALEVP